MSTSTAKRERSCAKIKLANGGSVLGCWSHLASPIAAEIVALAGYDFVLIDHEHGPGHYLDATALLHSVSATPCATLMRVPWNDPVHLKRALDTGIDGVVVPYVCTKEQAQQAVDGCRYPPVGSRGMAHVLCRASDYGMKAAEYARDVDANLLIVCMVETPEAVRNLPEIAAVDGVDVIFIGPFDLSSSMGIAGKFDHPELRSLLSEAEAAIRESGKIMGTIPNFVDDARQLFARGYQFVVSQSDLILLRDAALQDVQANVVARRGK